MLDRSNGWLAIVVLTLLIMIMACGLAGGRSCYSTYPGCEATAAVINGATNCEH